MYCTTSMLTSFFYCSVFLEMLLTFFNTLYDEEVITEDSFVTWKNDNNPSRQEAKGPAVQATTSFFEWMQSAAEEIHES